MKWSLVRQGGGVDLRAGSRREAQQAELFFVDLMGLAPASVRRRRRPGRGEADEAWSESPLLEGPLTESEWRTVLFILGRGEAEVGAPLTDNADRNALLVAARIFCSRNALKLNREDPLLCVVTDVTVADPRVHALVPHVTARGPIIDWTRVSQDVRVLHIMNLLVRTYGYPVNGAAGLVGNLLAESGALPQRVEGSAIGTPMRAKSFAGAVTDFTAEEIMNRDHARRVGPKLPGIGLAQWTSPGRRSGLFAHTFRGVRLGARVLFDMDAQVDYLVSELRGGGFAGVERVLRDPSVTVDRASDEVVYNFEIPGAILSGGRKLPRTDARVTAVFERRRPLGRSAERLYSSQPVAASPPRQGAIVLPAQEQQEALPGRMDITIRLHGKFGGDLSSTVKVTAAGVALATKSIGASDSELTVNVEGKEKYKIQVVPTAASPDDRYGETSRTYKPKAPYASNQVTISLAVNRWNEKNVYDTWADNGIDKTKAKQVSKKPLCGRNVNVNKEAEKKLAAANDAFTKLAEPLRREITESLLIVGGYAFRTQTTGAFSNHSLGTAIDVNYNISTMQNHHFRLSDTAEGKQNRRVLELVQEVVRTEAAFATFDIFAKRSDLQQWDAAAAFNRLFPPYLEALVARATGAAPSSSTNPGQTAAANLPQAARPLGVTRPDVKRAHDGAQNKDVKRTLELVLREWVSFQGWLYGTKVTDGSGRKVLGTLVGMIPMHRKFVELMLNAGWTWGGNWAGSKDYMHFEDVDAVKRLK